MKRPEVASISGHTLGASVDRQLHKDYRHVQDARTYGAPVFNITPHIGPPERSTDRESNYGDPVSSLEFKANGACEFNVLNRFSNHSYSELGNEFVTTKTTQIETPNPDDRKQIIA